MSFTRRYRSGTTVSLTAPVRTAALFVRWLKNGVHHDYNRATSLVMPEANTEMKAVYFDYISGPCNDVNSIAHSSGVVTVTCNAASQAVQNTAPVTTDWSIEFRFPDFNGSLGTSGAFVELTNTPVDCSPAGIGSNDVAFGVHCISGGTFSGRAVVGGTVADVMTGSLNGTDVMKIACVSNVVSLYKNNTLVDQYKAAGVTLPHDGSSLYLLVGSYVATATIRIEILSFTGVL